MFNLYPKVTEGNNKFKNVVIWLTTMYNPVKTFIIQDNPKMEVIHELSNEIVTHLNDTNLNSKIEVNNTVIVKLYEIKIYTTFKHFIFKFFCCKITKNNFFRI